MVYKMIVLLCSMAATPNIDNCTEATAISIDRMSRISPTAERCDHDSQHEQAQMLFRDKISVQSRVERGGPAYDPADRKIKLLCIPGDAPD
jgi:hypothetical protein